MALAKACRYAKCSCTPSSVKNESCETDEENKSKTIYFTNGCAK